MNATVERQHGLHPHLTFTFAARFLAKGIPVRDKHMFS